MNSSAGGAELSWPFTVIPHSLSSPCTLKALLTVVLFHTILIKIRLLPVRGVGAADLGGIIGIKVIEVDRAAWTTEIVEIDREVAL